MTKTQAKSLLTQVRRMRTGTLEPSRAKFGDSPEFRRLARDIDRVEEDLMVILEKGMLQ